MSSSWQRGTVVLVHGAWEDGSCWQNIILPLRRQGLQAIAAPLPLTSLRDDIAALERVIERTTGPVILTGHAYAGAVIAAVQEERVVALVYIAAVAPDQGETVADNFYRVESHPEAPPLAPDAHDQIWIPEEGFGHAVAHKASVDQTTILAAVQRPIALKCLQEKVSAPAWKTKPTWYLLAQEDRMIRSENQRFMAERMKATICSHNVDHTPMFTAPQVVIDVILEAANQTIPREE